MSRPPPRATARLSIRRLPAASLGLYVVAATSSRHSQRRLGSSRPLPPEAVALPNQPLPERRHERHPD